MGSKLYWEKRAGRGGGGVNPFACFELVREVLSVREGIDLWIGR